MVQLCFSLLSSFFVCFGNSKIPQRTMNIEMSGLTTDPAQVEGKEDLRSGSILLRFSSWSKSSICKSFRFYCHYRLRASLPMANLRECLHFCNSCVCGLFLSAFFSLYSCCYISAAAYSLFILFTLFTLQSVAFLFHVGNLLTILGVSCLENVLAAILVGYLLID